jgi:hypothetical protein
MLAAIQCIHIGCAWHAIVKRAAPFEGIGIVAAFRFETLIFATVDTDHDLVTARFLAAPLAGIGRAIDFLVCSTRFSTFASRASGESDGAGSLCARAGEASANATIKPRGNLFTARSCLFAKTLQRAASRLITAEQRMRCCPLDRARARG